MSRKVIFLSVLLMSVTGMATAAEYQPGEVIVKYKEGALRTRTLMNQLYDHAGVHHVKHFSGLMKGIEHLILADNVKVEDAIAELRKSDAVEYAQPNYILHAYPVYESSEEQSSDDRTIDYSALMTPTLDAAPWPGGNTQRPALKPAPAEVVPPVADPQMNQEYGLAKIGAPNAWKITRGSKAIIVADIDTGADYNHQDLSFNMWRNPQPTSQNDVVGFDFIHNDGLPYDDNMHGTHTAGTIGAVGGNGIGISGVAQQVSIMALKFLSGQGSGTTADAVRAIDYGIAHGARIMSNSWGGKADSDNQALSDAITRAQQAGVLFIAAAGNDSGNNDQASSADYPAAFNMDNMISVAATDSNDRMANFSNYGANSVHVGAPGVKIVSTIPGNKYKSLDGTSMACPHVAGAAALVWAKNPTWTYQQVKQALLSTADPLPSLKGRTITGGRINVARALGVRF